MITGRQNSGKTVMMMEIIEGVQHSGIPFGGLISPGEYRGNERIAIQVWDVATKEKRILADINPVWKADKSAKKWLMREATIEWGNKQLKNMRFESSGIFFLDEIGIYEVMERKGWQSGLAILQEKLYHHAVITVRKDVLSKIVQICEKANISYQIIDLDDGMQEKKFYIDGILHDLLMEH